MENTNQASTEQSELSPLQTTPLEMAELIDKIVAVAGDTSTMYIHIVNNTQPQYLDELIQMVVYDLILIPVARNIRNLELVDNAHTVSVGFKRIAKVLADFFLKDQQDIETRLLAAMEASPVDDVRQSFLLRSQNKLH
jgi:hypothetical protein